MTSREERIETETVRADPSRYIDETTRNLNRFSRTFEDVQKIRKAVEARLRTDLFGPGETTAEQRAVIAKHWEVEGFAAWERRWDRELSKQVRQHALWPFLRPLKGLAGARTGRIIAAIGDPRRFPGQRCTLGHTLLPTYEVGAPCPLVEVGGDADASRETGAPIGVPPTATGSHGAVNGGETGTRGGTCEPVDAGAGAEGSCENDEGAGPCPGVMLPPRTTTGVQSVWHYFGLYPEDGRLVRLRKTRQASFSPQGRAMLLGSQGTADQIVMKRTEPYRELYDRTKAAKLEAGYPPWRADRIARTVAVKAFLGDLLMAWKQVAA